MLDSEYPFSTFLSGMPFSNFLSKLQDRCSSETIHIRLQRYIIGSDRQCWIELGVVGMYAKSGIRGNVLVMASVGIDVFRIPAQSINRIVT